VLNGICHFLDHSRRISLEDFSVRIRVDSTEQLGIVIRQHISKIELVKVESRSLINIRKRMGPKTEPCGTPLETAFHEDF